MTGSLGSIPSLAATRAILRLRDIAPVSIRDPIVLFISVGYIYTPQLALERTRGVVFVERRR